LHHIKIPRAVNEKAAENSRLKSLREIDIRPHSVLQGAGFHAVVINESPPKVGVLQWEKERFSEQK
jgi:hypothetical protein